MREQQARPIRPNAGASRAFTLIELLAVIVIMGILLTLGAGATIYLLGNAERNKTISIMRVVHSAIDAYVDYNDADDLPDVSDTDITEESEVMPALITLLWESADSRKILQGLPEGAIKARDDGSETKSLFDSYGNEMKFDRDGGLGGTPRIISAGPDGKFGKKYNGTPETELQEEDNIRSDEHKK